MVFLLFSEHCTLLHYRKDTMSIVGRNFEDRTLVSCWILLCFLSSLTVNTRATVEGFAQLTMATTTTNRLILQPRQTFLSTSFERHRIVGVSSALRGGQQEGQRPADETTSEQQSAKIAVSEQGTNTSTLIETKLSITSIPAVSTLAATLTSMGKRYSQALDKRPILTKSVTACGIFAISDFLAQRLENSSSSDSSKERRINWTRLLSGAAVGLLYFGPAAHYWYEMIFHLLPGTSLVSTLQKAVMGQVFFGPSFTCVFFAVSLLQAGSFSLKDWASKIRRDLPGAWLAGAGFWPLVDLVSYSVIPKNYIPLFVNMCSLVWTVYLSLVANR